jgi:hypothetical protein
MRKMGLALAFLSITAVASFTLVASYSPAWMYGNRVYADAVLTRYVFHGVGDTEMPWEYIYVVNPTWQDVEIKELRYDYYVNGIFQPQLSGRVTPNWKPERWDTHVFPFERSVIVYFGYLVGEGEPTGLYVVRMTIYATVAGQDVELVTSVSYWVTY